MIRVVWAAVVAAVFAPSLLLAQTAAPPQSAAPPPAPPVAPTPRIFAAPVGMILTPVRPERVADFETVLGYLQDALATSTDATVRAQAQGWRVLKATEPGPNGSVLYVFVIDPTVGGAEYGLGRILAGSIADPAKLQEVWKLYTDSVASGGSLLNLTPVEAPAPAATDAEPPASAAPR